MFKPFYDFGKNIFRNELWVEYIDPVVRWFLLDEDKHTGYLLPQISGSIWECSLAIDFLLRVYVESTDQTLKDVIETKCINTSRWMISCLKSEENAGEKSWDSAPWDTAVALNSLSNCIEFFSKKYTDEEKRQFYESAVQIARWLVSQSSNWKSPDGYLTADATDLSVTLTVLLNLLEHKNVLSIPSDMDLAKSIDDIANMLLQCVEEDNDEGALVLSNWGNLFNVAEVICGLADYYKWNDISDDRKKIVSIAIKEGLLYIESINKSGDSPDINSVADSCGILWCYLKASRAFPEFDHNDIMVFKSLCWLCDSNKVMSDGSFLHSSYVTIFYALSLIEAYDTWKLGNKSTNEVYHLVVWLNPNIEITERAKRLDLELRNKNSEKELLSIKDDVRDGKIYKYTVLTIIVGIIISIIVLQMTGTMTIFEIKINELSTFFEIISISLVLIPTFSKVVFELLKKHYR